MLLLPRGGSEGAYVATFSGLALKKEAFRRLRMVASEGEKDENPRQAGFSGGGTYFFQVSLRVTVRLNFPASFRSATK